MTLDQEEKRRKLQDKLRRLSESHGISIPSRLVQLKFSYAKAIEGDIEALNELIKVAHQLRGTAANFGYPTIGLKCGEIEDKLRALNSAKDLPSVKTEINSLIEDCIEECRKPMQEPPPVAEAIIPAEAALAATCVGTEPKANILLVDDDPLFCQQTKKVGQQRLIEVTIAHSVEQAMELVVDQLFDGIIIDLMLDHRSGSFELARRLRTFDKTEKTPLAFISASGSNDDRLSAAQAGAVLFLDKPFEPENLETAVQHMQSLNRQWRPKVLIVDDDQTFILITEELLSREGYEVHPRRNAKDILKEMQALKPDIVILDLDMPDLNGIEVCRLLRSSPLWQAIPILTVSARVDMQTRLSTFRAGADDYLAKPILEEELLVKTKSKLERSRLLHERTTRDTISGTYIRSAFISELHSMFRRADSMNEPIVIAMVDLDDFKKVNDFGGHLIGDAVIASLGRLLTSSFRPTDLRGRWGGDEFVLALEGHTKTSASDLINRLAKQFGTIEFKGDKGQPFHVTFSAGLSLYPEEGLSIYDLIKLADERLYAAKAAGKDQVTVR